MTLDEIIFDKMTSYLSNCSFRIQRDNLFWHSYVDAIWWQIREWKIL